MIVNDDSQGDIHHKNEEYGVFRRGGTRRPVAVQSFKYCSRLASIYPAAKVGKIGRQFPRNVGWNDSGS